MNTPFPDSIDDTCHIRHALGAVLLERGLAELPKPNGIDDLSIERDFVTFTLKRLARDNLLVASRLYGGGLTA